MSCQKTATVIRKPPHMEYAPSVWEGEDGLLVMCTANIFVI